MKIPSTIASCCSEANRPRSSAGEISAMYAGATTLAIPTASPPTMRQALKSTNEGAKPVPSEPMTNSPDASNIVRTLPIRSAI